MKALIQMPFDRLAFLSFIFAMMNISICIAVVSVHRSMAEGEYRKSQNALMSDCLAKFDLDTRVDIIEQIETCNKLK